MSLENGTFDVNTKTKIKCKPYLNWGFVCPKCQSINMAVKKQEGKVLCLYSGCDAVYELSDFKSDIRAQEKIKSILSGKSYKTDSGLLVVGRG